MPKPCSRRSAASREPRRLRIVAMAPDSFSYQEIAETEGLGRDGAPQIVVESLKRGDRDREDQRRIQAARLAPAAPGERAEISPLLAPALASP